MGMSSNELTFFTALSCLEENPRVIRAIMSSGEGVEVPLVTSVQTSAREPSKRETRSYMGTGEPIPYCDRIRIEGRGGEHSAYVIWSVQKDLCYSQEYAIRDGQYEATQDI